MFLVFNKEKITSYLVAFSTVAILLTMSIIAGKESTLETSANYTNENIKPQNNSTIDNNFINNTLN